MIPLSTSETCIGGAGKQAVADPSSPSAFTNPEKMVMLETATAATTLSLMKDLRVVSVGLFDEFMVFLSNNR